MQEIIVYHAYNCSDYAHGELWLAGYSWARFLRRSSKILAGLGILVFLISFIPSFYYSFKPTKAVVVSQAKVEENRPVYQPNYNSQLPKQNRLLINSIGVDTPIKEALNENSEDALRQGG